MTSAPLAALSIWHTRPQPVAQGLAERCRALGARVISEPVLRIEPVLEEGDDGSAVRAILQRLDSYHSLIFVSGNAVRCGLPLIARVWPRWPAAVRCFAIGNATVRLLAEAGVTARQAAGPRMNSEELLELAALRQVSGQRILIVRGIGGRGYLAEVLTARGAQVAYLEAYRRAKSDTLPEAVICPIDAGAIDFITASSGETVENIVKLVDHSLHRRLLEVTIVVPGERVAAIARRCGFTRILIATNAGDDAMIEAIVAAADSSGR